LTGRGLRLVLLLFLPASALSKGSFGPGQLEKEREKRKPPKLHPLLAGTGQPRQRRDLRGRRNILHKLSDNVSGIVVASEEFTGCPIGSIAFLDTTAHLLGVLPDHLREVTGCGAELTSGIIVLALLIVPRLNSSCGTGVPSSEVLAIGTTRVLELAGARNARSEISQGRVID